MLHVVALSFEHRVGNQIDAVYPAFPDEPHIAQWTHGLPFIAIPDKAHGSCSSFIQFTLPCPTARNGCVFCLGAYRAVEASELAEKDATIIRSHVQRALCAISEKPFYGEIEGLLKDMLFASFNNLTDSLPDAFARLQEVIVNPIPFSGISYSSLFQALQAGVLTVFKALLLGKRVLVYAENSELVSKMVTAIGSLLPAFMYAEEYPIKFLDWDGGVYSFIPYLPLQFTEAVNAAAPRTSLIGTCNNLFLSSRVVEYDVLVDCSSLPAKIVWEHSLSKVEERWMKKLLAYYRNHWTEEATGEWLRSRFLAYTNTLIEGLKRVRHIREVPNIVLPYLDYEGLSNFGKKYVEEWLAAVDVRGLIGSEKLEPVDEELTVDATPVFQKQLISFFS